MHIRTLIFVEINGIGRTSQALNVLKNLGDWWITDTMENTIYFKVVEIFYNILKTFRKLEILEIYRMLRTPKNSLIRT